MDLKEHYGSIVLGTYFTVCATVMAFASYIHHWENSQPKIELQQAQVQRIESYDHHNDLHMTSRGRRVYIQGEERPIDFPLKNWDDTVKDGDTVDMVTRRSFPWFGTKDELDGISIDDHK